MTWFYREVGGNVGWRHLRVGFDHQTRRWSAEQGHAMDENSPAAPVIALFDGVAWFDPIEAGIRERMRGFIETMLKG